jgi:glucokinase
MTHVNIIADIGATNARFALLEVGQTGLMLPHTLAAADYANLTEAVAAYVEMVGVAHVSGACIAIAGPVHKPVFTLANNHWQVNKHEVEKLLRCQVLWLNDFAAQAWGVTALVPAQQMIVKSGTAVSDGNRLVVGPGSGLGVAGLVRHKATWVPVIGEGGHVSFAPGSDQQAAVLNYLQTKYEHVSIERVASGSGIPVLYQALAHVSGQVAMFDSAAQISRAAEEGDALAQQTMQMFFAILGQGVASAVLQMGALGGVYLVGGILPKLLEQLKNSEFEMAFSQRGRLRNYLEDIPISLSLDQQLGLKGAAIALQNS